MTRRWPDGFDPRATHRWRSPSTSSRSPSSTTNSRSLLVRRGQDPFEGRWALPGGFVRPEEDLEGAACANSRRRPVSWPARATSSSWVRTVRPSAIPACGWSPSPTGPSSPTSPNREGRDAADACLFPVVMVEADALQLAFDHDKIVAEAVERIRSKLEYTTLAAQVLPARVHHQPVEEGLRGGVERSPRAGQLPPKGHQEP